MRILEVLDCYYPKFDGPTLVITSYSKSFIKNNLAEVEIAVPKYPKYKDNQPFKVNRISSIQGPEGYRVAIAEHDIKLKKYLKNNKFDLIHIHSPFTLCNFFANYGKKNKIPTVFTFHTKYKEDFERTINSKIIQRFMMNYIMKNMNKVNYMLTVSNGAANCLRSYGYKKNINVIRNGTDLIYPDNPKELISKVNELYSLKEEEIVFLSVGRIVENKKLSLSLQALKIVSDMNYNFKFLIVGSGPYEKELKELSRKLNLNDKVIFTGKIMDRDLLSAHYLRSDLFIFPSTFDTASLAPIEAAAMKLPTLMTKGCPTAEIITNNQNGLLAEETAQSFAERIIYFIDNKEQLKYLKENALKQVYKSWDSVAEEVIQKYKEYIKDYNSRLK